MYAWTNLIIFIAQTLDGLLTLYFYVVIISALIPEFIKYHGAEGIRQKQLEEALRETETQRLMVE